jgi:nucleoside-diphosphate-sugar epimerase
MLIDNYINFLNKKNPTLILTGASGFFGRNLIDLTMNNFRLICISHRSQKDAGISSHPNIHWIQADIARIDNIEEFAQEIILLGGADHIIHFPAYHDRSMKNSADHSNATINGTKNILELGKFLNIRQFILASSLEACEMSKGYKEVVNEESPLSNSSPFSHSLRSVEELARKYSAFFACSVVRIAPVFSEYCENPQLYSLLRTWLSEKQNSRIIYGKGETSTPYIHINDLIALFLKLIHKQASLPPFTTFAASPSACISHNQLFEVSTKYYFGRKIDPVYIPKYLAFILSLFKKTDRSKNTAPNIFSRNIDRKLVVENSYTRRTLGWQPTRRYDILRRLLPMIEKMKNFPVEWKLRNEPVQQDKFNEKNFRVSEILGQKHEELVRSMTGQIRKRENYERFKFFVHKDQEELAHEINMIFYMMEHSVRYKEHEDLQAMMNKFASQVHAGGFEIQDVRNFTQTLSSIIMESIMNSQECKGIIHETTDYILSVIQLLTDETEEYYEKLKTNRNKNIFQPFTSALLNGQQKKEKLSLVENRDIENTGSSGFDHLPGFSLN